MNKGLIDTQELGEALLIALGERGWQIQRNPSWRSPLPAAVQQRYPSLPLEVTAFLGQLKSCMNAEQNVWFLCSTDFSSTDSDLFGWNFQELMSLHGAEGDKELQAAIRQHWDWHFPFMMAMHSGYDYLAVSLGEENYGAVVHGYAPEFDSARVVASSFSEFLISYVEVVRGRKHNYPLSYFL